MSCMLDLLLSFLLSELSLMKYFWAWLATCYWTMPIRSMHFPKVSCRSFRFGRSTTILQFFGLKAFQFQALVKNIACKGGNTEEVQRKSSRSESCANLSLVDDQSCKHCAGSSWHVSKDSYWNQNWSVSHTCPVFCNGTRISYTCVGVRDIT